MDKRLQLRVPKNLALYLTPDGQEYALKGYELQMYHFVVLAESSAEDTYFAGYRKVGDILISGLSTESAVRGVLDSLAKQAEDLEEAFLKKKAALADKRSELLSLTYSPETSDD